jgi:hypothetical protein
MLVERLNIDVLCARAEAFCRRLAPLDLGDTPIYIVLQTRVPAEFGGTADCDGFTTPSLDLYMKDVIGPAWRGRGACMVINDLDFTETMDPADIESALTGVALHELAHILERPAPYRDRQGADPARIQFEALCLGASVAHEQMPATQLAVTPPYEGHGHRFIRAALHLRYRAEVAGMLVPMFFFCAGTYYGLSHPNRYREALGDEPDRLAGLSIREILATPYPKAFWRLWTTDLARWHSDCSPNPQRSTDHVYRYLD